MPTYEFYTYEADGIRSWWGTFTLDNDTAAPPIAIRLLAEHPECAYVAAWEGKRPVLARYHARLPDQPDAQSRSHPFRQAQARRTITQDEQARLAARPR